MDYIKLLVEDIHSVTMATINNEGKPITRIIDLMLYDKEGIYFLTARGKSFYQELMDQEYISLTGLKGKVSFSLSGKVKNIGSHKLDEIFLKNIYMQSIYPGDTRKALDVFCLYEASGEYFDISDQYILKEHLLQLIVRNMLLIIPLLIDVFTVANVRLSVLNVVFIMK